MTESEHQIAYFNWCRVMGGRHPRLDTIFAIPNGGYRTKSTAGRLKAEGVRSGVWDIFVPVQMGQHCGLWIEMKAGTNKLTVGQNAFRAVVGESYSWAVCYSWHEAVEATCEYLGISSGMRGSTE
jgi:hypothetical protein